jgi:ABC-type Mn2+/Zn2+ transport system ATPase subunit
MHTIDKVVGDCLCTFFIRYFQLDNLVFILKKERFIGIVGENGSGKTTLFKCIYGLEKTMISFAAMENQRISGLSSNRALFFSLK